MKKNQTVFRTVLLCAFSLLLLNCSKDVVEPDSQTFNFSKFTDARDGKEYQTIKIGNQEWMAENLAFETDSDSWIYWNDKNDGAQYGRLYTWDAALQAVPVGFHLPTDAEWKQLEVNLGMSITEADGISFRGTNQGTLLKAKSNWADDGNGTNENGFSALPGGFRSNAGSYLGIYWQGYWWSATESDKSNSWIRIMTNNNNKIGRNISFKGDAYSVRCVKNS